MTSKTRQVVFVVDGLRPDRIDEDVTPTIAWLRREGVNGVHAHAVSPPVTRVTAAAIPTGDNRARNGLMGDERSWPAVSEDRPFRAADGAALKRLRQVSGALLQRPSLGRRLQEAGRTLVTVGSGSSGCPLPLAGESADGHGVAGLDPSALDGRVRGVPQPDRGSRAGSRRDHRQGRARDVGVRSSDRPGDGGRPPLPRRRREAASTGGSCSPTRRRDGHRR